MYTYSENLKMKTSLTRKTRSLPLKRTTGPWGPEKRLEFIDFRLQWDGRLNRGDLMTHFGISVPQASTDIGRYSEIAPNNIIYDRSERVYVASADFSAAFASSSVDCFLNELLGTSTGTLAPESSYLGWLPSIALASAPVRAVSPSVWMAFLRAMRQGTSINVLYQSMSRPQPRWRELTPHGVGHDGFRWHVRAFCHSRKAFRDFVIARVLEVKPGKNSEVTGESDVAWSKTVNLVLEPSRGLSESRRRVIELDYGMLHGEVAFECRHAMLYYVLQQLGLNRDGVLRPEVQQISLKNADEVKSIMDGLAINYD